jgi:hypothetical protein
MPASLPLPSCNAVLIADQVIVEAKTNKKTLVGLFSNIHARRLPTRRRLNFFVEISDALGIYDFEMRLVHLDSDSTVATGRLESIHSHDRLAPMEMVIHLQARFEDYGTYEFRMDYLGKVFASRTFRVTPAPSRERAGSSRRDGTPEG